MQVFGVTGPGADELVSALLERLTGRVAVVRDTSTDGGAMATQHAATTYERVGETWRATSRTRSIEDVLDEVAPAHEYAILVDLDEAVPTVAVGDTDVTDPLVRVADPASADLTELVAAVDDLEPHETLESLVAQVKRAPAADRAGAIATFTGRVRERDHPEDSPTEYLEFETYEDVAAERLATIEAELTARDGVQAVALHHRTGVLEAGTDIVFVVVLAGHREEAFSAARDGIDRLKAEVPIFKREVTTDETFWVHER